MYSKALAKTVDDEDELTALYDLPAGDSLRPPATTPIDSTRCRAVHARRRDPLVPPGARRERGPLIVPVPEVAA